MREGVEVGAVGRGSCRIALPRIHAALSLLKGS